MLRNPKVNTSNSRGGTYVTLGSVHPSWSTAEKANLVFTFLFCAALPESLVWCVVSTEEIWKCGEMATAFRQKNLSPAIQCISAKTKEECMELIQVGCSNPCAVSQISRIGRIRDRHT